MALSDIASGVKVTTQQRTRGVAAIDATDGDLVDRLTPIADELPCDSTAAATLLELYAAGVSIDDCANAVDLPRMTGAKALHMLGVDGVSPLAPNARNHLRKWIAGEISRTEARHRIDASDAEFALATFVETTEPLEDAQEIVFDHVLSVDSRDPLVDTRTAAIDLFVR